MNTRITITLAALTGAAGLAHANILDFYVDWSGAAFGNGASAAGTISIDDTLLNNPGNTSTNDVAFVTAFSITVTGTAGGAGDGTWTLGDFDSILIDTRSIALDLTQELVGQPTDVDPWGSTSTLGGDFNIFPTNGIGPEADWYFTIAAYITHEDMVLTSFRPVPVPGVAALLAVTGLGAARRRR